MLLDEKSSSHFHIDNYLDSNQIEPGQIVEVNSMDLLIEFSKIGLGIGCVIKEFVQNELNDHTLIELPLPVKPEKQSVGLIYRKTHLQSGSVNKFIEFYKGGTR
jgi:DNA-binding transcriptional LysR family regulator